MAAPFPHVKEARFGWTADPVQEQAAGYHLASERSLGTNVTFHTNKDGTVEVVTLTQTERTFEPDEKPTRPAYGTPQSQTQSKLVSALTAKRAMKMARGGKPAVRQRLAARWEALTEFMAGGGLLAQAFSQCDVPTFGRVSQTCRLFTQLQWHTVYEERRSTDRLGWEEHVDYIAARRPVVLHLPGNPGRRVPLPHSRLESLLPCDALRILHLRNARCEDAGAKMIGNGMRDGRFPVIHVLNLGGNKIGNSGATALGAGIAVSTSIKTLVLDNNTIKDEGAEGLAQGLARNASITRVNLADNRFHSKGATSIGAALKSNATVVYLDLSGNELGAGGGQGLAAGLAANKALRVLTLAQCDLTGSGGSAIGEGLATNTTLQDLDLSENELHAIGVRKLGTALQRNKTLKRINLRNNDLQRSGAAAVAESFSSASGIVAIDLSENSFDSKDARDLAKWLGSNTGLRDVTVEGGGGDFAESGGGEIRDDGVKFLVDALAGNTTLHRLSLPLQDIKPRGAKHLAGWLATNPALRSLDLRGNDVEGEGAAVLVGALASNTSLLHLSLEGNPLGQRGITELARGIPTGNTTLRILDLSGCNVTAGVANTLCASLAKLAGLTELRLCTNSSLDEASVRASIAAKLSSVNVVF
eukprot:m.483805 g.483805  ORF g.483805 m.483805 type:complete len:644 (+) comp23084_c0_seq1:2572-4503(+)